MNNILPTLAPILPLCSEGRQTKYHLMIPLYIDTYELGTFIHAADYTERWG